MTKKELKHLRTIRQEIERLRRRIEELETIVTATVKPLSDMPKGSGKENYNLEEMIDLKVKLEERLNELEYAKARVEKFAYETDDPLVRLALQLRYVDGLTWNEVADNIGGNNTENSVRMMVERYVKER